MDEQGGGIGPSESSDYLNAFKDAEKQGQTSATQTIGYYQPYQPYPQPCPGCGRCPTCGRGGYTYPYTPYVPVTPYPWPTITYCQSRG